MNNKGQTLALFVVILPVLLLLLVLIIDVGKLIVLKLELSNISELVLDYGLDHLDDEDLTDDLVSLVDMNKDDIDKVHIYIIDNKIYINMLHNNEGLFKKVSNITIFTVKTSYVGYIENEEKRIERLGD